MLQLAEDAGALLDVLICSDHPVGLQRVELGQATRVPAKRFVNAWTLETMSLTGPVTAKSTVTTLMADAKSFVSIGGW